ncbi:MAG: zinc ABC transporter substrate-binding protein, partial [Chromatiales bacterium]|nr:zinc ABC transporter substrate-binding protein [Chromatiales bacterium]
SQPGMQRVAMREGGAWDKHNHDEHDQHEHGEHEPKHDEAEHADEHEDGVDPHLWLSPKNAAQIVRVVSEHLIQVDKASADIYRNNAQAMLGRIEQLDSAIAKRLSPVKGEPYVVFHDAYHLFEQRYDLNAVGSVTVSPERAPGARRIHQLRSKIEQLNARCVFSEPQFQPKLVKTLIDGTDARSGVLDPLGSTLKADSDAYFKLMENLANELVSCLSR